MHLHIRDRSEPLVAALKREFQGVAGVEVSCGDIFDATADAIVSPANSFGFMDGANPRASCLRVTAAETKCRSAELG